LFPFPKIYPTISQIIITQTQQAAPYNNRGRLDDLILVADGAPNSIHEIKAIPTVYAVVTDADIEFRGALKIGDKISLYNLISGAAIITKTVTSDRELVSTLHLPMGVYVASVKDVNGEINSLK